MSNQDEYRQKLQSQLEDLDTRLDQLSERVEQLAGDARVEARKQLQAFRVQRGDVLSRLQNWDEVTHGVHKAWYELARSFDALSSRYK